MSAAGPFKTADQIADEDYKVAPTSADNVEGSSRGFPDWQNIYATDETNVEKLPWFSRELDVDLKQELATRNIKKGKFLDLGTSPATQALQLANLGFDVTGADISASAIVRAKKLSKDVRFVVDDILDSRLQDNQFDYIFDRGCFHVLDLADRPKYVRKANALLVPGGLIFLKTFSIEDPSNYGPHKFTPAIIKELFGQGFEILACRETVFEGTLSVLPKALFSVMKKRNHY